MSGIKFNNLKIITKSTTTTVDTKINETEIVNENVKLMKLEDTYKKVQKGSTTEKDFQKTLLRTQPKLLTPINDKTRVELNRKLKELLNWYISLKKILIGYDENRILKDNDIDYMVQKELRKTFKDLSQFTDSDRFDKHQSLLVKNMLKIFIKDNPIKPVFNVSNELISLLTKNDRTTSFVKEIALCFGLYRKYISKLAENFAKDIEMDNQINFKHIDNIQPRFTLINKHIQTSIKSLNPDTNRSLNLNSIIKNDELNNINNNLVSNQEISAMGLRKRLTEINNWLNNGIIHTQNTYNRLNNLKVRRNERNHSKIFEPPIDNNYMIWCLMKDIEVLLLSMEDLLIGKSFIVGINSEDILEILDVTY